MMGCEALTVSSCVPAHQLLLVLFIFVADTLPAHVHSVTLGRLPATLVFYSTLKPICLCCELC